MNKRVLSKWLRSGFIDRGALYPTTAGVPQGGIISPVISNMVLDGLEEVVHGGHWHRRCHNINYVRWADDFIVTANSREVLAETILPRINAFLAERGVRLSAEKTVITPLAQGFDFLGQTLRKHDRRNGQPAKLQITPSTASFQALKPRSGPSVNKPRALPRQQLIETLNPVLRGWANYHRHIICGQTFAQLDSFVWRRLYRWAKRRHPDKTGRWITDRYFPHQPGESWRFTDPTTGKQIIRVQEARQTPTLHQGQGRRQPIRPRTGRRTSSTATDRWRCGRLRRFVLKSCNQQTRALPGCRQVIQVEEEVELHHRDGNHQNNRLANLVLLHPTCHRQVHYAPESTTTSSRPSRGVGHA